VADALRFLTVLPVPGRHRPLAGPALVAFPLVGALLGLVWALLGTADRLLPVPVLAALVLVADAALTGGLHLDALADVADGVASRRRGDQAVAVMRDSAVGAVGALALALAVLVRWTALLSLLGLPSLGAALSVVAAPVTGRVAMVALLALLPPRGDGSLAAAVARPGPPVLAGAVAVGAVLCTVAGPAGLAALLAGGALTLAFAAWWRRRFGELVGDAVGACGLLAETSALLVLAGALA
jgi:adenosylcobinamide-GDP ribazoletransferase